MILIFLLLVKTAAAQVSTIDPSILTSVFGAPAPIILNNTLEGKPIFSNSKGEKCQCVPYYLCDKSNVVADEDNVAVTGLGQLDFRFGDGSSVCPRRIEVCCTAPKDPKDVPKTMPDFSKVRGCGYRNRGGLGVTMNKENATEAQFGEFPWVVAIFEAKTGRHVGSGAIIHTDVVITTAHLVYRYPAGALKVRAGEWDMETENEIFDFQERVVQEIAFIADFKLRTLSHDLALLRLQKPFMLSDHINTICIYTNPLITNCVANGWGKNVFDRKGSYSKILKRVDLDLIPHDQCQSLLRRTRLGQQFYLEYSFICAGGEEGVDTCQGDGGAPLACPMDKERYALTGMVAWGIGCGEKNVPGVYASVKDLSHKLEYKMLQWGYGNIGIPELKN